MISETIIISDDTPANMATLEAQAVEGDIRARFERDNPGVGSTSVVILLLTALLVAGLVIGMRKR